MIEKVRVSTAGKRVLSECYAAAGLNWKVSTGCLASTRPAARGQLDFAQPVRPLTLLVTRSCSGRRAVNGAALSSLLYRWQRTTLQSTHSLSTPGTAAPQQPRSAFNDDVKLFRVCAAMAAFFKSSEDGRSSPPSEDSAVLLRVVSAHSSVLTPFLSSSEETGGWPAVILDGAGGSELERLAGGVLHPVLWSAGCVTTEHGARDVKRMHWSYLNAGADIITAVSYQASIGGFQRALLVDREEATRLLRLSARLAVEARDEWWRQHREQHLQRERPLVAASIGSFGALLAGGEEYTGDYRHADADEVEAVQRAKVDALCDVDGIDALLLETMPNLQEVGTLLTITLPELCPDRPVIISLATRDGVSMPDGTPLATAFAFILDHSAAASSPPSFSPSTSSQSPFSRSGEPRASSMSLSPSTPMFPTVVAFGVNCCSPDMAESAMQIARQCVLARWKELTEAASPSSFTPSLPLLVVYPNSGEEWEPQNKEWTGTRLLDDGRATQQIVSWYEAGARIIGGCCRTTPLHIKLAREVLTTRRENADAQVAAGADVLL